MYNLKGNQNEVSGPYITSSKPNKEVAASWNVEDHNNKEMREQLDNGNNVNGWERAGNSFRTFCIILRLCSMINTPLPSQSPQNNILSSYTGPQHFKLQNLKSSVNEDPSCATTDAPSTLAVTMVGAARSALATSIKPSWTEHSPKPARWWTHTRFIPSRSRIPVRFAPRSSRRCLSHCQSWRPSWRRWRRGWRELRVWEDRARMDQLRMDRLRASTLHRLASMMVSLIPLCWKNEQWALSLVSSQKITAHFALFPTLLIPAIVHRM